MTTNISHDYSPTLVVDTILHVDPTSGLIQFTDSLQVSLKGPSKEISTDSSVQTTADMGKCQLFPGEASGLSL